MRTKAVISLTTGLEDAEKVTVACEGCPSLADLTKRYADEPATTFSY